VLISCTKPVDLSTIPGDKPVGYARNLSTIEQGISPPLTRFNKESLHINKESLHFNRHKPFKINRLKAFKNKIKTRYI
jgi:hypothetical protein